MCWAAYFNKWRSGFVKTSGMRWLWSRSALLPLLIGLAVAIVIAALLSPPDKTLGDAVKLVYVHGAIIRVVLATFVLSGLGGLGYLIIKRSSWYDWSVALEQASLILWVIYLVISAITTIQSWGAIAWFEPRWVVSIQVAVLAGLAYLAGRIMRQPRLTALLNLSVPAIMLLLLSQAQLVMHPPNPIGASGDTDIQIAYAIMLGLWALVGLQLTRWLHSRLSPLSEPQDLPAASR
jgi:hypothetical protein